MNVVFVLWLREVKKYLRSRVQIVASLGGPLMYLGVLGFGLGPVFQRAGEGSYLQFMAPGVIGMAVLFTAMFSGIAMLWDRQFGFLKETLVAPVPRLAIMIGRTLGGATVAVLQGTLIVVVTLIAGFRPVSVLAVPLAFFLIALIAVVFAALATAIGSTIKEMQGFQMVMNFLVMPILFLSAAIYPLQGLPRVLAALTRVDPLTYGVDGMRGLLTGNALRRRVGRCGAARGRGRVRRRRGVAVLENRGLSMTLLPLLLAAQIAGRPAIVYTTAESTSFRLTPTDTLTFKPSNPTSEGKVYVFVDPRKPFQPFIGIGGALTDAAAETFAKLPAARQDELITAYYSTDRGIGYTLGRTNIHSCDFSSESYTYVTEGG